MLQDAWLDVNFTPKLRVRAGKMKVPFGLERLQSGANLLLVERGFPTLLAPNRDVGVQVHGELAQGAVAYQVALMNGVPDGGMVDTRHERFEGPGGSPVRAAVEDAPHEPVAWSRPRLRGHPRRSEPGIAVAAYKGVMQVNVFAWANGVTADGNRDRLSPQAWFYLGPVGFLAEYVRSSQRVARTEAPEADDRPQRSPTRRGA